MHFKDPRDLDELKALGSGKPAPEEIARLYRSALAAPRLSPSAPPLYDGPQPQRVPT